MLACGPVVAVEPDDTSSSGDTEPGPTSGPSPTTGPAPTTTSGPDTTTGDPDGGTVGVLDLPPPACDPASMDCTPRIDLLLVIDNSGTMGEEQQRLARALPQVVEDLEQLTDGSGVPLSPDVNVMVTTTDFGNPLCTPFEPPGYDRARGAPVSTSCTSRLDDFTSITGAESIPEACQDGCPVPVEPSGQLIHFDALGDNIPDDVAPADVDGDGDLDSPAAQALACIGPQGINGCGYESPLEDMLQAINPDAAWNLGDTPFLRPQATLAIVIVTDEADCSIYDYSIMEDPAVQNTNPDTGQPSASSAICWNAGVECTGPDAMGVYADCTARDDAGLQPVARYTSYLVDELRGNQGKEVVMIGLMGVPSVTAHNPEPPYQPIAGGEFDLVYRNWVPGPYPAGDILPADVAQGETAADKQFDFGIGPGCTGTVGPDGRGTQALPPVRMREVCHALDYVDDEGQEQVRCCIESICDDDYDGITRCLAGLFVEPVPL
jgi:hypothetical protein